MFKCIYIFRYMMIHEHICIYLYIYTFIFSIIMCKSVCTICFLVHTLTYLLDILSWMVWQEHQMVWGFLGSYGGNAALHFFLNRYGLRTCRCLWQDVFEDVSTVCADASFTQLFRSSPYTLILDDFSALLQGCSSAKVPQLPTSPPYR